MTERVEIRVSGRVQGVAFRWATQKRARALGVTGWVRNQPDGSVRIVAEGEKAALDAFCDWTAVGPDPARVDERTVFWGEAADRFDDFLITG